MGWWPLAALSAQRPFFPSIERIVGSFACWGPRFAPRPLPPPPFCVELLQGAAADRLVTPPSFIYNSLSSRTTNNQRRSSMAAILQSLGRTVIAGIVLLIVLIVAVGAITGQTINFDMNW